MMSLAVQAQLVELDWYAYYQKFLELHGEPVVYGSLQLFEDGYRYGMAYEGPEYPPPENPKELKVLKAAYLKLRMQEVDAQREILRPQLETLRITATNRGAPLMHIVVDSDGKRRAVELNLDQQKERLQYLDADYLESQMKLEQLEAEDELERTVPLPVGYVGCDRIEPVEPVPEQGEQPTGAFVPLDDQGERGGIGPATGSGEGSGLAEEPHD